MLFLLFLTVNRFIFFVVAIPIGGLFSALAFVKINEAPLVNYVLYAINYIANPKQYVFKKEDDKNLEEIIISGNEDNKEIIISDKQK